MSTPPAARTLDGFARDYRIAFLRFLARREEVALAEGYALGRAAVADGMSVLDLVQVHHDVLSGALAGGRPDEVEATTAAAGGFLLEVLGPFDMAHRRLLEQDQPPG